MLQTNVSNQAGLYHLWQLMNRADTRVLSALREHLLAQVHDPHTTHKLENLHSATSASPHDHNIDPAIAGTGIMSASAGESGGEDNSDGKKGGKRELSTSKRAAQNRAAQVSFLFCLVGNAGVFGIPRWKLLRFAEFG